MQDREGALCPASTGWRQTRRMEFIFYLPSHQAPVELAHSNCAASVAIMLGTICYNVEVTQSYPEVTEADLS